MPAPLKEIGDEGLAFMRSLPIDGSAKRVTFSGGVSRREDRARQMLRRRKLVEFKVGDGGGWALTVDGINTLKLIDKLGKEQ